MNEAEKLAAFIVETQANVRRLGEEFKDPDDDWISIAFLQGENETYMIGMAGETFANENSKDMLAMWLKQAMIVLGAKRYAVLFNVHGLENPSGEDWEAYRNGKRIAEFPNAYEMLLMVAGDAEQELGYHANITRDGVNPPTLAEWKHVKEIEGRFSNLNAYMNA